MRGLAIVFDYLRDVLVRRELVRGKVRVGMLVPGICYERRYDSCVAEVQRRSNGRHFSGLTS